MKRQQSTHYPEKESQYKTIISIKIFYCETKMLKLGTIKGIIDWYRIVKNDKMFNYF